ncbi:SLC13 family permease [Lacrimispora brassicae]
MTAAYGSILILLIAIYFYITELVPIAVTAMGSCLLLALFGFAKASDVWAGISSDTTLFVGGMIAIITAVIETGAAKALCAWFLRIAGGHIRTAAFMMIPLVTLLSGFMNNSAAVAITLPVLAGIIASDGELHEKHWFMPLAVGSNVGGMITVIGTTSQIVIQNALLENNLKPFGFFEFAWVGIPMCITFFIYFKLFGKYLNRKIWPDVKEHSEFMKEIMKESNGSGEDRFTKEQKEKQILSICIMIGTIMCIIMTDKVSNGTFAMFGTLLVIVTGCISIDEMYRKFDWTTIFVLSGGIGFASGLDKSGGGRLIADLIASIFGSSLTPMHVFTMFVLTGALLTIFMSNTAVAAMLTPIALAFTQIIEFNIAPVLMGICMATNCAFLTPLATPSMTMILGPGGYKFMDYVKYCILFNIIAVTLLFLIIPRVWPL